MFNLFGKKKGQSFEDKVNSLNRNFTKEQKAAIIAFLVILANCDKPINNQEKHIIEQTALLLNLDFNDPIYDKFLSGGTSLITNQLDSLDKSQKEWLVITIHGVILADGEIEDIEASIALGVCQKIGISETTYVEIVQKTSLLVNQYLS